MAVVGIYQEVMLFKEANEQMHHATRLVNSPVNVQITWGRESWVGVPILHEVHSFFSCVGKAFLEGIFIFLRGLETFVLH